MRFILSLLIILSVGTSTAQNNEEVEGTQRAWYECGDYQDIDRETITEQKGEVYFQFNTNLTPGDLKELGYTWLENKPENYFIAYLVNMSDSTFNARRQDGSLIMIQEALDEDGEWRPIEYWVHSGCGNSYFDPLKLESGKCIMLPIRKYTGSFTTTIRMKMRVGSELFYSAPFAASINKKQFNKQKETVHGILFSGDGSYLDSEW